MELYFIRHGQSYNNALIDVTKRVKDPELTKVGWQQAERLAQFTKDASEDLNPKAKGYTFSHIYCSPMHRALQTAQPLAETMGIAPEAWVDLHEVGGIFLEDEQGNSTGHGGLSRAEIAEQFPSYILPDTITEAGWWPVAMTKEDETHTQYRALRVAAALRERADSDDRIALVSHAGFLDRLLKALLNQLPDSPRRVFYAHYNTGITRIDFMAEHSDQMRLLYINRLDHLPYDMRTW